MSSEKYVICPHCGGIADKNSPYCGTCGGNVKEQKKGVFEPHNTPPRASQDNDQASYSDQFGYSQPQSHLQVLIEEKLKMAWLFAWITLCMGVTLFLIVTIYFALEAKKLGSTDSKIKNSVIIASIGVVLKMIVTTVFYIFYFVYFLPMI
ncbi:MAG: hypothetical protein ACTSPM_14720 [Candidatus Heimdallarchaeota archaeon]